MEDQKKIWVKYSKIGKWAIALLLLSVLFMQQTVFAAAGNITGIVFRDYDADGTQDGGEPGVGGVIVTAYDANGTPAAATTASDGTYTIVHTFAGDNARVEFTLPGDGSLDFLQPGAAGNTTVQFVDISTAGTVSGVDVGLNNPANFCQANPQLATSVFTIGDPENAAASGQSAIVESAYLSGSTDPNYTNGGSPVTYPNSPMNPGPVGPAGSGNAAEGVTDSRITDALIGDVGPVSGLAFHRESNTLLGASYMKRFAGFPDDVGTPGRPNDRAVGTIYAIDRSVNPNAATEFYYFPSGTDTHDYATGILGADTGNAGDIAAREDVGFKAWGDIDLTEDGTLLYGLNYFDKSIHMIPVVETGSTAVAGTADIISIPSAISNQCNGASSDSRNWVLGGAKTTHDSFYFGITCTAFTSGSSNDLHAYLYSIPVGDASPVFTLVADTVLDYPRIVIGSQEGNTNWQPWVANYQLNNSYHQPHLTDIEFDENGNMIVALTDRSGEQAGAWTTGFQYFFQAGELLRLTPDGDGTFTFEDLITNNPTNDEDLEFFIDSGNHEEMSFGEVAVVFGTGEVVNSSQNGNLLGGLMYYNSTTGTRTRYYAYTQSPRNTVSIGQGFGKANAIGDVEPLCNPAPIELGNRVWEDTDGDGIQDPGESGLNGVTVTLHDMDAGGAQVGSALTSGNGDYLFGGVSDTNMTSGSVLRGRNYEVRIATGQGSLTGLNLTLPNRDGQTDNNALSDLRDSDAALNGATAVITYITGSSGTNNHALDFGFTNLPLTDYGDLPDTFDTTAANTGPVHNISSNLYLGDCVDGEADGQPDAIAGGDDNNIGGVSVGTCADTNDEDGIQFLTPLIAGAEACVSVTAVNNTGSSANLYGFIDYNGDGDFDADSDNLLNGGTNGTPFTGGSAAVPNGGVTAAQYCFDVPASATFNNGATHLRFRLTSDSLTGSQWAGAASNGEVEDYYTTGLTCVGNYLWLDTGTTTNTQDAGDTAVADGTTVNLIWGGPDGVVGTSGDNVTYSTTTSGGVYNFCGLLRDVDNDTNFDEYQIIVPTAPGTPVTANQGDDALDSDGAVNGAASDGPVFTMETVNTDDASNDTDPASFGDDQTDLSFDFGFAAAMDFGDLPESGTSYATLLASDGARHILDSSTYMGACVDGEADGQPDNAAGLAGAGDDGNNGAPDVGTCGTSDENGVTLLHPLVPNRPAAFQVTTSGDSCLSVFIDFNNDGTLDAVTTNASSPTHASTLLSDVALSGTGPHEFQITVPANATGVMYSRFRLTATCGEGGNSANGVATSGEVEDYVLAAAGDYVWEDADLNGLQGDADTVNNNGLTVHLLDGSGNAVNDASANPITVTTANDGSYSFPGILPGVNYMIRFTTPAGFSFAARDQGGNNANDSDANVFDGRTIPFSVLPAVVDSSWDAGIYAIANLAVGNRVWADTNNDGVLNNGESGIAGAAVHLYTDDGDGVPDAGDVTGGPIRTINTDSDGYYIFGNLAPATNYIVCVDGSTTGYGRSSGTPIGNHAPSGTEENQANGDDGAPLGSGNLVCSQVFTAALNGAPTTDLLNPVGYDNDDADMQIDFGFTASPTAVTVSSFNANANTTIPAGLTVVLSSLVLIAGSFIVIRRRRPLTG